MKKYIISCLFIGFLFSSCQKKYYESCKANNQMIQAQNSSVINENKAQIVITDSLRNTNEAIKKAIEGLQSENAIIKNHNDKIKK